jgi:hypothetical protein
MHRAFFTLFDIIDDDCFIVWMAFSFDAINILARTFCSIRNWQILRMGVIVGFWRRHGILKLEALRSVGDKSSTVTRVAQNAIKSGLHSYPILSLQCSCYVY